MIRYLPGWTYISKRGVRVTLMSVNGDRVTHCNNSYRSALTIAETSLKNFKAWTDERRTLRLHKHVAKVGKFDIQRNWEYVVDLLTLT